MTESSNGNASTLLESTLLRDSLDKAIKSIVDRYLRTLSFSFTVRDVTVSITLSPYGSVVALALGAPPPDLSCLSPDQEPSRDQTTATATP